MRNILVRSWRRWTCINSVALCLLGLTPSLHASQQKLDVTGLYGVAGQCTDEGMEQFVGNIGTRAYLENCFNGQNKFSSGEYLILIQNGKSVCGYFYSADPRISEGRMLGRVQGNILILHHETENHASGPAPMSKFIVSESKLTAVEGSLVPSAYVRRAKKLQPASKIASCKTEAGRDYILLESGKFKNASGLPDLQTVNFSDFKAEKPKKRPNPLNITILDKSRNFDFKDRRQKPNYMARNMTIANDSKTVWQVCAVHPPACQEQYRFDKSNGGRGSRTFIDSQGFELSSKQSIKLLSCKNSVWVFQNKTLCDANKNAKGCEC